MNTTNSNTTNNTTNINNTNISHIIQLYNNAKTMGSIKDKNKYYKILQKLKNNPK